MGVTWRLLQSLFNRVDYFRLQAEPLKTIAQAIFGLNNRDKPRNGKPFHLMDQFDMQENPLTSVEINNSASATKHSEQSRSEVHVSERQIDYSDAGSNIYLI